MRATDLIKDNSCPRTRATECSCSTIKTVTESLDTVIAQCDLQHSDTVKGTILFIQAPGTETLIKGTVSGLEPGDHGFHIHEFGDMSKGCESMGAHYNPDNVDHGNEDSGHVGDLGNINAGKDGVATVYKIAKHVDLLGDRSVVGRGVVVHADPDDLGQGKNAEAKLKLEIFGEKKLIKEVGNGPIDAIFNALKALIPNKANLIVYQVNAITKGTDAQAEVDVRLEEKSISVQGQGSDIDTMVASAKAYINAMNKLILKRKRANDSKSVFQTSNEKLNKHVI